jgi:SAM-dependent methyltransferase
MSFDTLATHYRWMEFVLAGERLQRCRTAFLRQAARKKRVLILGEGNGRFLAECRRALGSAEIVCVDASARMLALARERVARLGLSAGEIEFVHADALAWRPPENAFDLIVTHFFLDCFPAEQVERLVGALATAAEREATWLLADFGVPAGGLRRWRAVMIHRLMYLFFRAATGLSARRLTEPDGFLERHDFRLCERKESEWGLLHSDRWERTCGAARWAERCVERP